MIIGIDACSGDSGGKASTPKDNNRLWTAAGLKALQNHRDLELLIAGEQKVIKESLSGYPRSITGRVHVLESGYCIGMDEKIIDLEGNMKEIPQSKRRHFCSRNPVSYIQLLNLLKKDELSAAVSATNTKAMIENAVLFLGRLDYFRCIPPLTIELPNKKDDTTVFLDVGANIEPNLKHMPYIAIAGLTYSQAVKGITDPKMGLVSIGTQEYKGTAFTKAVHDDFTQRFAGSYIGMIEPKGPYGLFEGSCDVMVADGDSGNKILKAMESTADFVGYRVKHALKNPEGNLLQRMLSMGAAYILKPQFERIKMDSSRFNGAPFFGFQGQIYKSHGGSDAEGMQKAIEKAYTDIKTDLFPRYNEQLEENCQKYME